MQPFTIKCHSVGKSAPLHSFFILSRGPNTGRPSYTPNVNCFVFSCASQDIDRYYWLIYAMWNSRKFEKYFRGSVIQYILLDDLKLIIAKASKKITAIDTYVDTLQKFLILEAKLKKQIEMIHIGRCSLLQAI